MPADHLLDLRYIERSEELAALGLPALQWAWEVVIAEGGLNAIGLGKPTGVSTKVVAVLDWTLRPAHPDAAGSPAKPSPATFGGRSILDRSTAADEDQVRIEDMLASEAEVDRTALVLLMAAEDDPQATEWVWLRDKNDELVSALPAEPPRYPRLLFEPGDPVLDVVRIEVSFLGTNAVVVWSRSNREGEPRLDALHLEELEPHQLDTAIGLVRRLSTFHALRLGGRPTGKVTDRATFLERLAKAERAYRRIGDRHESDTPPNDYYLQHVNMSERSFETYLIDYGITLPVTRPEPDPQP